MKKKRYYILSNRPAGQLFNIRGKIRQQRMCEIRQHQVVVFGLGIPFDQSELSNERN